MTRLDNITTLAVRISAAGFLITAVSVAPTVAQECVAPVPGLVSWWDGDSVTGTTAIDIGDGNDGVLVNGAFTSLGKVGNAFSFDGVGDYVEIPDNDNLDPQSFTLEYWFKLDEPTASAHVSKRGTPFRNSGYSVTIKDHFPESPTLSCTIQNVKEVFASTNSIPLGVYHHVACTYEASIGEIRIYFNSTLVAVEFVGINQVATSRTSLLINAHRDPSGNIIPSPEKSHIDEVGYYNRALLDSEIEAIFNADSSGKCKPDTLDFFCEVVLNETVFIDGDQIIANVARLTNLGRKVNVEVKAWFDFDGLGLESHTNIGGDGTFWLAPGFDIDLGPIILRTVNAEDPRGTHGFNCRLLNPVSGDHLETDINEFLIE